MADDDDDDLPSVLPGFSPARRGTAPLLGRAGNSGTASASVAAASSRTTPTGVGGAGARVSNDGDINDVLAFCPELARADVQRDLLVSGSPQATINRYFDGQFLDGALPPDILESAAASSSLSPSLATSSSCHAATCSSPVLPSATSVHRPLPLSSPVSTATTMRTSALLRSPVRSRGHATSAIFDDGAESESNGASDDDDARHDSSDSDIVCLGDEGGSPSLMRPVHREITTTGGSTTTHATIGSLASRLGLKRPIAVGAPGTSGLPSQDDRPMAIAAGTSYSPTKRKRHSEDTLKKRNDLMHCGDNWANDIIDEPSEHEWSRVDNAPLLAGLRRDSIDSRSFTILDDAELFGGDGATASGDIIDDVMKDAHRRPPPASSASSRPPLLPLRESESEHDDDDLPTVTLQPTAKRKRATPEARDSKKKSPSATAAAAAREQKQAKKTEEKAERREKQLEKTRAKAAKKISTEARQAMNREQSLKNMRMVVDDRMWDFPNWPAVFGQLTAVSGETSSIAASSGRPAVSSTASSAGRAGSTANPSSGAFDVVLEEDNLPIANAVRWRRIVVSSTFDEDSQDIVRDESSHDEPHAVVLWTAAEFAQLITNSDGDDTSLQLAGTSLRDAFTNMEVTLLVVGMKAYLSQCSNAGNRDFRSAVRRLGTAVEDGSGDAAQAEAPAKNSRKSSKKTPAVPTVPVSKLQVEDTLVALQLLCPKLRIRQTETPYETARLLFQMTKAIAHDPLRKADTSPFSFYAEGQSHKPIKIDGNGVGCERVWQQQLRQIHGVGHDKSMAICRAFPSPRHLLSACLKCKDVKEIDQVMTAVEVRRGTGVLGRVTHVGKDFGRQLHRFIVSRDGEELLDGSGRRTD